MNKAFDFSAQYEFEERVLGVALVFWTPSVLSAFKTIDESVFTSPSTKWLYRTIMTLHSIGHPVELPTVISRFEAEEHELPAKMSTGWLIEIAKDSTSPANIGAYCSILTSRKAMRDARNSLAEAMQIIECERDANPVTVMQSVREAISRIDMGIAKRRPRVMRDVAETYIDGLAAMYEGKVKPTMTPTAPGLSNAFGNISSTDLIVIAGRPGSGKTETAVALANDISIQHKKPALFISLEMGETEVAERSILAYSGISINSVSNNSVFEDSTTSALFGMAISEVSNAEFYIDDQTGRDVYELCRDIEVWAETVSNPGAIIIDYLSLIKLSKKTQRHDLAIGEITGELKALAKKLEVPVILLAQVSRDVEKRPNKRPMSSDLRDSGSIEQDADRIVMVYRDAYYDAETPMENVIELINTKRRRGSPESGYMRFVNGHLKPMTDQEQTRFALIASGGMGEQQSGFSPKKKKRSFLDDAG